MENEQTEWMWTISGYLVRIRFYFCFALFFYFIEIRSYVFLFCIDDNVET